MVFNKVNNKVKKLKKEFSIKLSTLVIAAFGLVAALAWNEAMQSIFHRYYEETNGLTAKIVYAFVVTCIAVLVTLWLSRYASKNK